MSSAHPLTDHEVALRHAAADLQMQKVALGNILTLSRRCLHCFEHPGSKHRDGSGVCEACSGTGWVLVWTEVTEPLSGEALALTAQPGGATDVA